MLFSLRLAQNIILCGLFNFIIIVQQGLCTSYSTELPLFTPWLMKYHNSRLESLHLARCYLQTFDFSVLAVEHILNVTPPPEMPLSCCPGSVSCQMCLQLSFFLSRLFEVT